MDNGTTRKAENHNARLSTKTVQKRLKAYEKSFRFYREKLIARYGDGFAEKVMADTRTEYEEILFQTPGFPGMMNIFNLVMGANAKIVSFHKAMRGNGRAVEETGKVLFELAADEHQAIPAPLRWIARKAMFSRLFLWLARSSAKKVHNHPEGWKVDYQKGDGEVSDWCFDCSECGVIKYYKKHRVEELCQYCNYIDYLQSKVLGLGLQNPKNIGQGDSHCVEYFKQGRETAVPENLAGIVP